MIKTFFARRHCFHDVLHFMFYKEAVKKLARYAQMHYLNFSGKIHLVIAYWGKFLIGLVHFSV